MKIRYFAWLRQRTGCGEETLDVPSEIRTVGDLMDWLGDRHPGFKEVRQSSRVIRCAVNQEYAPEDTPVGRDDEVAFFPPVTGG